MDAVIEKLVELRAQVQALRDTIKSVGYTRPPAVAPELLAEVRQRAEHVRSTRQAVQRAEQVVAEQSANCQTLAADGTDSELAAANLELRQRKDALEMALQRAQAAVDRHKNISVRVQRDAEAIAEQRRQYCAAVVAELGGVILGQHPRNTFGCAVEALAKEVQDLVASYRHETVHHRKEEIRLAIAEQLERVPQPQRPAAPMGVHRMVNNITPTLEVR